MSWIRVGISAVVLSALLSGCSLRARPQCPEPSLSREQIIRIVDNEIRRRGGTPAASTKYKIRIKRDGCDFLYQKVYLPERPGGYLFVRVNSSGEIVRFVQGA